MKTRLSKALLKSLPKLRGISVRQPFAEPQPIWFYPFGQPAAPALGGELSAQAMTKTRKQRRKSRRRKTL